MNQDKEYELNKNFYLAQKNFLNEINNDIAKENNKKYIKNLKTKKDAWVEKNKKLILLVEKNNSPEDLEKYIKDYHKVKNEYLIQQYMWLIILIVVIVALIIGLATWLLKI
ncbi:hypothetical protein [Mycoplasmopsis alligatoris]|uniref:hypothetical protein n=1 Tax=Mycoplasmopsis alligatoris TaxID=47687 RepID=UPI000310DBCD|nr:hypothetical protein [Mycoplasmopsis alligatoris]